MPTQYPGAVDNFTNPTTADPMNSATVPHAAQHANINDAVEAIQTTLGTNPQGTSSTVKDRIVSAEGAIINLGLAVDERVPGEAGSNAPAGTVPNGYMWVNTTDNSIKVWNGSAWASPAGGAKILQVVQATLSASASTTSTAFVTTGLTAAITPTSASSKILVTVNGSGGCLNASAAAYFTVFRGTVSGTNLGTANGINTLYSAGGQITGGVSISRLDSPATTSPITYTYAFRVGSGGTAYAMESNTTTAITLMEVAA